METFSKRLRKLRTERKMSQSQMANEIGLARTGYAEIEHGVSVKTFRKLPAIAKTLGCRIDDLFPEMDEATTNAENKTVSADGFEDEQAEDDDSCDGLFL